MAFKHIDELGQPRVQNSSLGFTIGDEDLLSRGIERAEAFLNQVITENEVFGPSIYASLDPRFFRPFARDSIISADLLDGVNPALEKKAQAAVLKLWDYQSRDGKIPHELEIYSKDNALYKKGFYHVVGKKRYLVNNDSVDSTPLLLIKTAEYMDPKFKKNDRLVKRARKALLWVIGNMDGSNGYLSYRYTQKGLVNQGWMDSVEGVADENGKLPKDPIALVEAQALAWKAFKVWAKAFRESDIDFAIELDQRAADLKRRFNKDFYMPDVSFFAHALDGDGKQIKSKSINVGFALWASFNGETIIDDEKLPLVVQGLTGRGFLHPNHGIKLFEDGQPTHDKRGYHNAQNVYWPFISVLVAKGMIGEGFRNEGLKVLKATIEGLEHPFHNGNFSEQYILVDESPTRFTTESEQGCLNQTWTGCAYVYAGNTLLSIQERDPLFNYA